MTFLIENIHFLKIIIVFLNLYDNSIQLNFKLPQRNILLTPCHSAYTIAFGNYKFDYDSKVTGSYNDCTFLIESPPGTQITLNATISILNNTSNDKCINWLKLYDFHSNTTLIPFGEYCESTNLTNLLSFSNIVYIVIKISSHDKFNLSVTT